MHTIRLTPLEEDTGTRLDSFLSRRVEGLTRSLVLEAQFQQPTATLSSGGEFPDLLAQGVFSPEAQLTASETDLTGSAPKGFQAQRTWNYTLSGSQGDTVTLRLRVREDQKQPAAAL